MMRNVKNKMHAIYYYNDMWMKQVHIMIKIMIDITIQK